MTDGPKLIYQLLPKILGEVGHIAKERKNQQQGYQYRGIEDVYAALQPLLAKHEVFPTCEVLKYETTERESGAGKALFLSVVHLRYTLWASDGSSVWTEAIGEAMDSGDKSFNKSLSAAYKYAFFQMFCIPTEAVDSETDTYEVAPRQKDRPERFDPGPQRGPASPRQVEAQSRQVQREMAEEPPRKQYDDKPACPECGETFAVRAVPNSRREPGEPIFYCWKKLEHPDKKGMFGCGTKFDAPGDRNSDPGEGSQAPPAKRSDSQEPLDSFDAWARILLSAPAGAEAAAVNTLVKAYENKRLTSEYVYQIVERAIAIAQTEAQVNALADHILVPIKDKCGLAERGKFGYLNWGELIGVALDRIEMGGDPAKRF